MNENNIDVELENGIVRTDLIEHIRHNREFKKTNIFINFIYKLSRNILTLGSLIYLIVYLKYNESNVISSLNYIDFFKFLALFFLVYICCLSSIILIREIFLFCMMLVYGERFERGLVLTDKEVMLIAEKLNIIKENSKSECLKIVDIRNDKNSFIYNLFTEGNDKKLIEDIVDLEIRINVLRDQEKERGF